MTKIIYPGLLLLGVLFGSCKNEELNVGGYLVDPRTKVVLVDTLTVKLSNIAVDSVISSSTGVSFAGYYNDSEIGKLTAQSYFGFGRTSDTEVDRYAQYDSATLILTPNGNYYGDTLKRTSFKIFRLVKPIELRDDGRLYSTSTVSVGEELLDTAFRMRLWTKEKVELTLPRSLGEELFNGIKYNEDAYNADHFSKTFPGLSLAPGTGSGSIYGFNAQDTACKIRVYYHVNTTRREDRTMTFNASGTQFYHLDGKKLPNVQFTSKDDPIPSGKTGNKGFLMSGTPMYTRLEFPYLNNFLMLGEIVKIQQAVLTICPTAHSYDTIPLPPKLNLFYHDPTSNNQGNAVTGGTSSSASVLTGNLDSNYPNYVFDITSFISEQMGKIGYSKWALSVSIPRDEQNTTLYRLVFGDQNYWYKNNESRDYQVQLRVTYVTYGGNNF